jgi:hypothetical protein
MSRSVDERQCGYLETPLVIYIYKRIKVLKRSARYGVHGGVH